MIVAIDPSSAGRNGLAMKVGDRLVVGVVSPDVIIAAIRDNTEPGDVVYCETIECYGMAVGKAVFETCFFIGEYRRAAADAGVQFVHCYRSKIKIHLCNSVKAKDGNIRQALIDRWGEPGTKKKPGMTHGIAGDGWAALAVLTYAIDTHDKLKEVAP